MMLSKTAGLRDLQHAAALQVWHMRQQLERGEFTPFQVAYFLNELAAAALDVSEEYIKTHDLKGLMVETKARTVKPRRAAPKRVRKPKVTDAASDNA